MAMSYRITNFFIKIPYYNNKEILKTYRFYDYYYYFADMFVRRAFTG